MVKSTNASHYVVNYNVLLKKKFLPSEEQSLRLAGSQKAYSRKCLGATQSRI